MNLTEINIIALVLVLVGWAFNLGILWQMSRDHKERLIVHDKKLSDLQNRIDDHHEKIDIHTTPEWRMEMRGWMDRLDAKLEMIQKQCLDRISKGIC